MANYPHSGVGGAARRCRRRERTGRGLDPCAASWPSDARGSRLDPPRRGYIDPWTEAAHRQNEVVVGAAAAAAGRLVQGGYNVVFDGVIGPWFLEAFLNATELDEVHYVMLLPPEDVCLQRVGARAGHGFTDPDAARHMCGEFARAARPGLAVIRSTETPHAISTMIVDLFRDGALRMPAPDPSL